MNILKKRISLILCVALFATAILPIFVVNAAVSFNYEMKLDGKAITFDSVYEVKGGEKITFKATATEKAKVSNLAYQIGADTEKIDVKGDSVTMTVPTGEPGDKLRIYINAGAISESGDPIEMGWKKFYVQYAGEPAPQVSMDIKMGSKKLTDGSAVTVEGGEKIEVTAKSTRTDIEMIGYYFYENNVKLGDTTVIKDASATITVPTGKPGSRKYLYIEAVAENDEGNPNVITKTGWQEIILNYKPEEEVEPSKKDIGLIHGGKELAVNSTTTVEAGDGLKAFATPKDEVRKIYMRWQESGEWVVANNMSSHEVFVPDYYKPGSVHTFIIKAIFDDGTSASEEKYMFKMKELSAKDVGVSHNGKNLAENSTTIANPNESMKIFATPEEEVLKLFFKWDNEDWAVVNNTGDYSTRVPDFEAGSKHTLYVKAEYKDGTTAREEKYIFEIPEDASDISMNVKLGTKTITPGKTYEVKGGELIKVTASSEKSDVDRIEYSFDSAKVKKENGSKVTFEVPEEDEGTVIELHVEAIAKDGATTGKKTYKLKFVDVVKGELDIEPWMEENDEITELSINLRNDSEEKDKANKNIYALDETVTYFIDYKNGTDDDIDSKVTIKFEIPLDFDVVSADDGEVDKKERVITWEFPDGLEEGEANTLIVKLKYTSFSKSKYDNERIYPSAAILEGKKEKDRSTVINLIIEDYDQEIEETHEPYMFGDEGKDTFRPNDTITRAEGALVLARIYGLNYKNTKVTNSTFSDLDETYPEAQKAIIAATEAGLINGYTNGTFKPNEEMTKAEFIKILACMVEETAKTDDIEGLEIKEVDNSIKVYKDSTRYYIVNGKKIYSHWALEEVTLLARLNMLPLSEDEDEIELDEKITRAEVAQLVNFYLLRAPADVDSKTKTQFSDVSKKHDLFADIVEATRDDHTFSMNEDDGTEVEE